ncbi:MAG: serine/threonine protein kinase [Desulfobacterales bacterium]|nr:serine/threonine protein kinase [Desulfobacterales bacterium]
MQYGRYQILEELGRGSMGVVYKAHDPQIDRLVALKVLRPDRVTSEDFVQRFLKEARAIGRLSHPNIVTVFDVGRDHGTIYIAMEFLRGKPLNEIIRERQSSLEEITDIVSQVAQALNYAHANGIVHRDIKPSNIIVSTDRQIKITDFGIAHIEDPSAAYQTQAGEILGTPVYMSPEQVIGQAVDGRSDLYSLGVILYEMSTYRRPFKGENLAAIFRAITHDTPIIPVKAEPTLPKAYSELIMKSINKKPHERFQTGKEMAEALQFVLKEKVSSFSEKPFASKKSRFKSLLIIIIFFVLSLAGGYFYYSFYYPKISEKAEQKKVPYAFLKVESEPIGASIFLDGSFQGKTPLKFDLPFGKYEVRLSLNNYYEWEAQLQLDREGETPLFVRLIPIDEINLKPGEE